MGGILWISKQPTENPIKIEEQQKKFVSTYQAKVTTSSVMTEQDKAILDLKRVKDSLNKRLKQMELGIEESQNQANQFLKQNNIVRTRFALQKQQLYQKYLEGTLNQEQVISNTIRLVQDKYDQLMAVNALSRANQLMKDINCVMDIDSMQDTFDNLQELQTNNNKFDELYAQYVGIGSQEVQTQLSQMQAEIFRDQLNNHQQNTEEPILNNINNQNSNNLQQNQYEKNNNNIPLHNNQSQNDDIDDQLAMLA